MDEGLWPEHLPALRAFLAATTQWRWVAGLGGALCTGLDYGGARAAFDLAGIEMTPALWADVQVIEQGALAALNGD